MSAPGQPDGAVERRKTVVSAVIIAWAGLASAFFFTRFTFVFYEAHRGAISALIEALSGSR